MQKLYFRKASLADVKIYFDWINEEKVREYSFNSDLISWENHVKWFCEKINNPDYYFYIFYDSKENPIGQVRIQLINDNNSLIGVSIDQKYRGFGYGAKILKLACLEHLNYYPNIKIHAYIKEENIKSKHIFDKAGFKYVENTNYNNFKSYHYIFYADK